MTYCQTTSTEAHIAEVQTLRKVIQQATDQYPRLAAFLLTLPNVTPETVEHFHDSVYQQVRVLAISRQLSGRPVPPTVLRWIWASLSGQAYRHLLLLNQDTFCQPVTTDHRTTVLKRWRRCCGMWLVRSMTSGITSLRR